MIDLSVAGLGNSWLVQISGWINLWEWTSCPSPHLTYHEYLRTYCIWSLPNHSLPHPMDPSGWNAKRDGERLLCLVHSGVPYLCASVVIPPFMRRRERSGPSGRDYSCVGPTRYGPAGIPIGPSPERLKYLLRRGPCECMVEAVSPLFPYEYSLHNKPLILKLYYLEFLVFSILKSLKNMN